MNAVTIIEAAPMAHLDIPRDLSCSDWIAMGRDLMRKDRETKWQAADWYAYGRARAKTDSKFAEQMALALPEILEDPRKLDAIARVAEVFPTDERSLDLSFDHYSALASLPHGEARKLLAKAATTKAGPREIKYEAMQLHMTTAPRAEPDQDSMLTSLLHHWNRLPRAVRLEAAAMIAESNGEEIEP